LSELLNGEMEWFIKYGLIIGNFLIIVILLIVSQRNPHISQDKRKNVLFATAHPDDETMFFVPTIKALRSDYNLFLLCVTNGDAEKLGKVRHQEMNDAGQFLEFKDITVLNDEKFQDGKDEPWDLEHLQPYIESYMKEQEIDLVITFDDGGVSGHPNHISVYRTVKKIKESGKFPKAKYYMLETVNTIRKYIGIFDILFTARDEFTFFHLNFIDNIKAMALHHSQFVWFRKLFVFFSRYTFLNSVNALE